jgi:type I restriction-modification system DNA methylase subunit
MARVVKQQYTSIVKMYQSMLGEHQMWELWQDSMIMFACSISNAVDARYRAEREEMYMKLISKYTSEHQQTFPKIFGEIVRQLETNPEQDFLGDLYMTLELGSHWHGQFFTPYHVCQMMAKAQLGEPIHNAEDVQPISVLDCACGGGALLIAAGHEFRRSISGTGLNAQDYIVLHAQDLSQVSAMMCYLQLSLLGFAAKIKIGDSLMNPLLESDNGSDIWYTPVWFSGIWSVRRYAQMLDNIFNHSKQLR